MATTTTINVELTYTDYSTRTYKIPTPEPPVTPEQTEAVKTAIRNFNTAAQTQDSSVQQTFLSENGAPVASINEATVVVREEEVLYSVN